MAAQYSTSGGEELAPSSQTRPASLIATSEGSAPQPISNSTAGVEWQLKSLPSRPQLPSLDVVGQTPPQEAKLPPGALPSANTNVQLRPITPGIGVSSLHRGGAYVEEDAGQRKRLLGELNRRPNDDDGVGTPKQPRLQATHDNVSGQAHRSVARRRLERSSSCSTSKHKLAAPIPTKPIGRRFVRTRGHDNQAGRPASRIMSLPRTAKQKHPQSRRDSFPRGASRDRRGRKQLQDHRAGPVQPVTVRTRPTTPAASNRGSDADPYQTAPSQRSVGLSPSARQVPKAFACEQCSQELVELLRWFRKHVEATNTPGRQPDPPMQPTVGSSEVEMVAAGTSSDDDSFSESGICHTDSVGSQSRSGVGGGRRARWTRLEESRLIAYRQEDKDWAWIARPLKRSEGAIKQHWGIMGEK
jgi:hypothetical protein